MRVSVRAMSFHQFVMETIRFIAISPLLQPILCKSRPGQVLTTQFLTIQFRIIFPPVPESPAKQLYTKFSKLYFVHF
jgi:hypothetical protein